MRVADEHLKRDEMCPSCGATLAQDSSLCITCGWNRRTGKRLATKREHTQVLPELNPLTEDPKREYYEKTAKRTALILGLAFVVGAWAMTFAGAYLANHPEFEPRLLIGRRWILVKVFGWEAGWYVTAGIAALAAAFGSLQLLTTGKIEADTD